MRRIEPYFQFRDDRGEILGLLQGRELRELNHIRSRAGTVRGGHYHQQTNEYFFILTGSVEVTLEDPAKGLRETFTARPGEIFQIEPGETHTFRMLEDSSWINLLDRPMDETHPDIHTHGAAPK